MPRWGTLQAQLGQRSAAPISAIWEDREPKGRQREIPDNTFLCVSSRIPMTPTAAASIQRVFRQVIQEARDDMFDWPFESRTFAQTPWLLERVTHFVPSNGVRHVPRTTVCHRGLPHLQNGLLLTIVLVPADRADEWPRTRGSYQLTHGIPSSCAPQLGDWTVLPASPSVKGHRSVTPLFSECALANRSTGLKGG